MYKVKYLSCITIHFCTSKVQFCPLCITIIRLLTKEKEFHTLFDAVVKSIFFSFYQGKRNFYVLFDSSLSYQPYEIKFIFWEAQSINFEVHNVCSYWMAISKNETINTFMINLMIIAYICLGILATFIKNTIMDWISQNLPNFYLSNHRPCIQYVWNLCYFLLFKVMINED